jgi:hypothetical protein
MRLLRHNRGNPDPDYVEAYPTAPPLDSTKPEKNLQCATACVQAVPGVSWQFRIIRVKEGFINSSSNNFYRFVFCSHLHAFAPLRETLVMIAGECLRLTGHESRRRGPFFSPPQPDVKRQSSFMADWIDWKISRRDWNNLAQGCCAAATLG